MYIAVAWGGTWRWGCSSTVLGMELTWARLRQLDADRPWAFDATLAIALFLASAVAATGPAPQFRAPDATLYGLLVLGCVPYAMRRRAPMVVLVAASLPVLAIISQGYSSAVIGSGLFLAAYTVAAQCSMRATTAAGVYVAMLLVAVWIVVPRSMSFGELATNVALFAGAITLGLAAATRRENAALLRERAELAERARAEHARHAANAERLRLARDLHDIVAHSLAVISVQAGVGAHVIDRDPDEAKASLLAVSERSSEALAEIRRILGALRDEDDLSGTQEVGLADVTGLAAEFSEAGLPVTVHWTGRPSGVPPLVDRTGYRIVQESLTNTLRHAGPARCDVHVTYQPKAILLEIVDDGAGLAASATGTGHGLNGMRERVAAIAGSLENGPRPGGGYRVAARLPYVREVPQ
jgi:signal transduction histidine kinase